MEKEFVPHELAVKLKELGFDEPCFVYYNRSNENKPAYPNHGVTQNSLCGNGITAPTFSQAFRWFREKHDLQYWLSDGGMLGKSFVKITGFKQDKFYFSSSEPMEYEEAELYCLTKLIEIVELKSE